MEATGANNIMTEFDIIAETDTLVLFGKQLGIQRTRPSTIWLYSRLYNWSLDFLLEILTWSIQIVNSGFDGLKF